MNNLNEMFSSSAKCLQIQQTFKTCTSLEQLYTMIELARTLQISYQHFFIQLFQINIQNENNDMFNHTIDDANSPDIVNCLLSNNFDKILFTIQLYLPLISTDTFNEKLFNAYRNVLMHLDANLSLRKFTYDKTQVINFAQQICFYISVNQNLQKLSNYIPKLIHLAQTENFYPEKEQYPQQSLQRYQSVRSQVPSVMNFSSEGVSNLQIPQQLIRHETNDSGVDLTEPSNNNSIHNFFSQHSSKCLMSDRHSLSNTPRKHLFVGKTTSSPIPEHASIDGPIRVPLTGVLSAPTSSTNRLDSQKQISLKSQEKYQRNQIEHESQNSVQKLKSEETSPNDTSRSVRPFFSQHYQNAKTSHIDDVSQYLGVETNSAPVANTFIQPNSGMKDVQAWLKHLRLHKYGVFFSQMTYDEMMNLTIEQLKESRITEGACTKILLNIRRLKERSNTLKQYIIDYTDGQIDLPNLIQQLSDIMITPIRSRQLALENQSDEDIPKLIIEVLEKIFQQLPSYATADVYHSLLLLVDRCYKHEAFNEYAHLFLQWRRRLSNILQSFGRLDFRSNQQRRVTKPSIRPIISSTPYSTNVTTLSKYNSEPQNHYQNELNFNRYPIKSSPPHLTSTYEESSDMITRTTNSSNNQGAYLVNQQHQRLSRKPSIIPMASDQKMKLCKTYSDPHKIRSKNFSQSTIRPQQNLVRMISTPYSQQTKQYISRSPPSSIMDTLEVPSIQKSYSDNEKIAEDYLLLHNIDSDNQQHQDLESNLFCHQITNNAIGDDTNDLSIDYKETSANLETIQQSSNNCIDMDQW